MPNLSRDGVDWTHDEVVFVLGLYFQIPGGKINQRNPEVVAAAELLGRTPGSLGRKMGNLGHFDPTLQVRGVNGLTNGAKMDKIVWDEFADHCEALAAEYDRMRAQLQGYELALVDKVKPESERGEEELERLRRFQNRRAFRRLVLQNFNDACCVSGLNVVDTLRAYPIVLGRNDLSPENALCLAATYAVAFKNHLITFDEDMRLVLLPTLSEHATGDAFRHTFKAYEGLRMLPARYIQPSDAMMRVHRKALVA